MAMKRAIVVMLLVGLVIVGCQGSDRPTTTPALDEAYVPVVSVTGELIPARWATLTHKGGGKVVEVLVEAGDPVAVGAPLVLLDTAALELALQRAQGQFTIQRAGLALLRAGATEETIARADRDHAHQVAQAEIALQAKQEQLVQAEAADAAVEVAAAEARAVQVERQIAQVRAQDPVPQVQLAQVEVERAQIALDDTQDEYNKALDRPWEDQAIQAKLNRRAAQAQLDQAEAAKLAHTRGLAVLEAQLEEARAMLAQAQAAQASHQATLDLLRTEIEGAEEQLGYLSGWENPYRDPARREEIAQAEAALAQAQVQIAEIEQQLREATLVAPFAGTVGAVYVRVGEIVSPGQPLATVGDLSTLRVETTDLDEIDVVRVAVGQQVAVTFDALPDRVFEGRVTRISPMAESGTGGVHYTTVIELEEMELLLRWGMTAFVDIEAE
jgi:multidrug efflux pump subunit AcrA (membrane-fusion protein)